MSLNKLIRAFEKAEERCTKVLPGCSASALRGTKLSSLDSVLNHDALTAVDNRRPLEYSAEEIGRIQDAHARTLPHPPPLTKAVTILRQLQVALSSVSDGIDQQIARNNTEAERLRKVRSKTRRSNVEFLVKYRQVVIGIFVTMIFAGIDYAINSINVINILNADSSTFVTANIKTAVLFTIFCLSAFINAAPFVAAIYVRAYERLRKKKDLYYASILLALTAAALIFLISIRVRYALENAAALGDLLQSNNLILFSFLTISVGCAFLSFFISAALDGQYTTQEQRDERVGALNAYTQELGATKNRLIERYNVQTNTLEEEMHSYRDGILALILEKINVAMAASREQCSAADTEEDVVIIPTDNEEANVDGDSEAVAMNSVVDLRDIFDRVPESPITSVEEESYDGDSTAEDNETVSAGEVASADAELALNAGDEPDWSRMNLLS